MADAGKPAPNSRAKMTRQLAEFVQLLANSHVFKRDIEKAVERCCVDLNGPDPSEWATHQAEQLLMARDTWFPQ